MLIKHDLKLSFPAYELHTEFNKAIIIAQGLRLGTGADTHYYQFGHDLVASSVNKPAVDGHAMRTGRSMLNYYFLGKSVTIHVFVVCMNSIHNHLYIGQGYPLSVSRIVYVITGECKCVLILAALIVLI